MNKIQIKSVYRFPYCLKDYLSPMHYWREIKRFFQRGIYGYDETYHWGFDYEIAELIINVLPKLKNAGIPMNYYIETIKGYTFTTKTTKSQEKKVEKLRNDEIDMIVENLKAYQEHPHEYQKAEEAMTLFVKRFGSWWD